MWKWLLAPLLSETATAINIVMKQFRVTVRASGVVVATMVHADNVTFAIKLLHALFGAGNVISVPTEI